MREGARAGVQSQTKPQIDVETGNVLIADYYVVAGSFCLSDCHSSRSVQSQQAIVTMHADKTQHTLVVGFFFFLFFEETLNSIAL